MGHNTADTQTDLRHIILYECKACLLQDVSPVFFRSHQHLCNICHIDNAARVVFAQMLELWQEKFWKSDKRAQQMHS